MTDQQIKEAADAYAKSMGATTDDKDFITVSQRDIHNYMTEAFEAGYKEAQTWISVHDRLPEEPGDHYYLVNSTTVGVSMCQFLRYTEIDGSELWEWEIFDKRQVTHWQPLPSPPEG